MENNQNLKNKLTLLLEAFEFYGNELNHQKNQNNNTQSLIELDGGHIARHTMKIVGKLNEFEMELDSLGDTLENMDSPEEILNKINEIMKNVEE